MDIVGDSLGLSQIKSLFPACYSSEASCLFIGGFTTKPQSHTQKRPNTLVIHSHKGVEVLSLDEGRPLTKLRLTQSRGTVHLDLNQDGVTLEKVQLTVEEDGCRAEVGVLNNSAP